MRNAATSLRRCKRLQQPLADRRRRLLAGPAHVAPGEGRCDEDDDPRACRCFDDAGATRPRSQRRDRPERLPCPAQHRDQALPRRRIYPLSARPCPSPKPAKRPGPRRRRRRGVRQLLSSSRGWGCSGSAGRARLRATPRSGWRWGRLRAVDTQRKTPAQLEPALFLMVSRVRRQRRSQRGAPSLICVARHASWASGGA